MKWWTIINIKNYNISNKVIIKTPWICTIKCYSVSTIYILYHYFVQSCSGNCCYSRAKGTLSNFIPILYLESVMLYTKPVYNGLSLELNTPLNIISTLVFFNSKTSSVGW